jgi:mono/diheme cytochrome c family protein
MRWTGLAFLMVVAVFATAQTTPADSRGELLYRTHCVGCHTTQVHWREKKLASDWKSLAAQVERWQMNAKLGWNAEDVGAVARYLNKAFYRFPVPDASPVGEAHAPRIARRD